MSLEIEKRFKNFKYSETKKNYWKITLKNSVDFYLKL